VFRINNGCAAQGESERRGLGDCEHYKGRVALHAISESHKRKLKRARGTVASCLVTPRSLHRAATGWHCAIRDCGTVPQRSCCGSAARHLAIQHAALRCSARHTFRACHTPQRSQEDGGLGGQVGEALAEHRRAPRGRRAAPAWQAPQLCPGSNNTHRRRDSAALDTSGTSQWPQRCGVAAAASEQGGERRRWVSGCSQQMLLRNTRGSRPNARRG
jgi:hypothetical protein